MPYRSGMERRLTKTSLPAGIRRPRLPMKKPHPKIAASSCYPQRVRITRAGEVRSCLHAYCSLENCRRVAGRFLRSL
jgi:hypothetical protein